MLSLDQPTNPLSADKSTVVLPLLLSITAASSNTTHALAGRPLEYHQSVYSVSGALRVHRSMCASSVPTIALQSLTGRAAAQRSQAGCATEKESVSAATQTKRSAASGEEQLCASQYMCVDILHTQIYAPCMYLVDRN